MSYDKQLKEFSDIADDIGALLSIYGHHTSGGCKLPVVELSMENGDFFVLRNNFYDINIYIDSENLKRLEYSDISKKLDLDWYNQEIASCREYVYDGWTEQEMNDPRILRVKKYRHDGSFYWSSISAEKKDRWANRYADTDWYKDWSSGSLVRVGYDFFRIDYAYAEGMSQYSAFQPFKIGMTKAIIAVDNMQKAAIILKLLANASE